MNHLSLTYIWAYFFLFVLFSFVCWLRQRHFTVFPVQLFPNMRWLMVWAIIGSVGISFVRPSLKIKYDSDAAIRMFENFNGRPASCSICENYVFRFVFAMHRIHRIRRYTSPTKWVWTKLGTFGSLSRATIRLSAQHSHITGPLSY